jgi:hypothetical protein
MSIWIDELQNFVEPSPGSGDDVDWDVLERSRGLRFPSDYRDFVSIFGAGDLGNYLYLLTPGILNSSERYVDNLANIRTSFAHQSSLDYSPLPLYPDEDGMLHWGGTDEGDFLFWDCRPDDPDLWKVIQYHRQMHAWIEYNCGMVELLVRLLNGELSNVVQGSVGLRQHVEHTFIGWREEVALYEGSDEFG